MIKNSKVFPQRISAGGIVLQGKKVLLVHHFRPQEFDFWVMPGGGLQDHEGIFRGTEREVWEETGLRVSAQKIVYLEELIDNGTYVNKFWLLCVGEIGRLSLRNRVAEEDFLKAAGFFRQDQVARMVVFPVILKDDFWKDLENGFPTIKYLGNPISQPTHPT